LVSQSFTRRFLAEREPLGALVRLPGLRTEPFNAETDSFEIIGVTKDVLNRDLTGEVSPEIYIPYTITGMADYLVVRTQASPAALTNSVRSRVYAIDPNQPVTRVSTLATLLDDYVFARRRFNLVLFSVFAALGLTLAVIGVYGVISKMVADQTRDIGIRMALGAGSGDVTGMVLRSALRLLLLGIAVGLLGSFATTHLLAEQIWNVSPFDPLSFAAVSMLLLLTGLQACIWPARRAARLDPMEALRHE
jgi:ABC-type antimicrobial peptide transport system permease subunit